MSKAEILQELPRLSAQDLAEVQAKLDELAGQSGQDEAWHAQSDLTEADKSVRDAALAEYQKAPDAGSTWDEVKARVQTKLRP